MTGSCIAWHRVTGPATLHLLHLPCVLLITDSPATPIDKSLQGERRFSQDGQDSPDSCTWCLFGQHVKQRRPTAMGTMSTRSQLCRAAPSSTPASRPATVIPAAFPAGHKTTPFTMHTACAHTSHNAHCLCSHQSQCTLPVLTPVRQFFQCDASVLMPEATGKTCCGRWTCSERSMRQAEMISRGAHPWEHASSQTEDTQRRPARWPAAVRAHRL